MRSDWRRHCLARARTRDRETDRRRHSVYIIYIIYYYI